MLDKGVVIDARVRIAVVGLHVIDLDVRVVVASIETYVKHAAAVAHVETRGGMPAPASAKRRRAPSPLGRPRVASLFRCARGCTFRRRRTTTPTVRMACPYPENTVCTVTAA